MSISELHSPEKRVVGLKQVQRSARLGLLEKVYIAKDADEAVIGKLKHLCESFSIDCDMEHTMHQIGNACSIDVGSSSAGVLKHTQ